MRITILALLVGVPASSALAGQRTGLQPGDRYSVRLKYSNTWSESTVIVEPAAATPAAAGSTGRPRAGASTPSIPMPPGVSLPAGSATPAGLSVRRVPRIDVRPIGEDPLLVDLKLDVERKDDGGYSLIPRVSSVRYFDDSGRRWTIELREARASERALMLAKQLTLALARESAGSIAAQMLEEQLVGAAIVLLHESAFEAVAKDWRWEPELKGFGDTLTRVLPEDFPRPAREAVARFFQGAAARVVERAPTGARPGTKHEVGGMSYSVEKTRRPGGSMQSLFVGSSRDAAVGVVVKERFWADSKTGVPVEGSSLRLRETQTGTTHRFDAVKWETRLETFSPAPTAK